MSKPLILAAVLVLAGCSQSEPAAAPQTEASPQPVAAQRRAEAAPPAPAAAVATNELLTEHVDGPYSNTWTAQLLRSAGGQSDLHVLGEGKTVDFDGVLSLNCEPGGSGFWKAAGNFGESGADPDAFAQTVVPAAAVAKARALYCTSN